MTQLLTVNLAPDVVYCSGVVNGSACAFTLAGLTETGSVWTAIVDRADDDIYHIELTAVSSLGTTATFETVVYYGMQSLVTDRTAYDVERWRKLRDKGWTAMTEEERAEWASGKMKGAYNPPYDMNRVGAALNYLRDRLERAGYLAPNVFTAKADWLAGDIPNAADLAYYLNCVQIVRKAVTQFKTTPPAPTYSGGLDYQEANNIERILQDVDRIIDNLTAALFYCAELQCGEV